MVVQMANKAEIDPNLVTYIVTNESNASTTIVGDMKIKIKGQPVRSRGIWQISQYFHPTITDEEAFDPVWSTTWALPYLASSTLCVKMWATCHDYYNNSSTSSMASL